MSKGRSGVAGRGGPSKLQQALRSLKLGIFGTIYLLSKKSKPTSRFRTGVDVGVRIVQMLAFITSKELASVNAKWSDTMAPLEYFSSLFTSSLLFSKLYTRLLASLFFYLSLSWVVALILLLLYSIVCFIKNEFPVLFPLRVLSVAGRLSAGPLFIPLAAALLSPFRCADPRTPRLEPVFWQDLGTDCASTSFLTLQIVSVVLVIVLVLIVMLFAAVFYPSNPLTNDASARAHGRGDVIMILVQLLLVAVAQVVFARLSLPVILVVMTLSGAAWMATYVFFLPAYSNWVNVANVAGAAAFLWGVLCLALNNYYPATDAGLTFLVGIPVSALAGVAIVDWRSTQIQLRPLHLLTNAYEVEIKCRYILHSALWGHPTQRTGGSSTLPAAAQSDGGVGAKDPASTGRVIAVSGMSDAGAGFRASVGAPARHGGKDAGAATGTGLTLVGGATANGAAGSAATGAASKSGVSLTVGNDQEAMMKNQESRTNAASGGVMSDDPFGADDADDRAAALRRCIPFSTLQEVQEVYRYGLIRFRSSSILHVFSARFYSIFLCNKHMQLSYLLQAERRSPAIDVSFTVFQARKQAEDSSDSGSAMSALGRVALEKHSADARRYVMQSAMKQLGFFQELTDVCPDLSRLHRLAAETNEAIASAERAFQEVLSLNSQSLSILRLYAAFTSFVLANPDKAAVLTAEADRVEDAKGKDHRSEGATRLNIMGESALDLFTETTALITVSASRRDLGTILSANANSCKLLGYPRLALERRSVFTLMPPPLDAFHEAALRSYVMTGEGSIVDHTRLSFVLTKAGTITPVISSFRDAQGAAEGREAFLWVLREVRSPAQYIMLDNTYALLAVSPGSQSLLSIEPSSLAAKEATMADFCEEWDHPSVQSDLRAQAGATIRIDVRAQADDGFGGYDDEDGGDALSIEEAGSMDGEGGSEGDDEDGGRGRRQARNTGRSGPSTSRRLLGNSMGGPIGGSQRAGGGRSGRRGGNFSASGFAGANGGYDEGAGAGGEQFDSTWVRAHMQSVELEGQQYWVLHWARIPSAESFLIEKAEQRRAALLGLAAPVPAAPAATGQAYVDAMGASRVSGVARATGSLNYTYPTASAPVAQPTPQARSGAGYGVGGDTGRRPPRGPPLRAEVAFEIPYDERNREPLNTDDATPRGPIARGIAASEQLQARQGSHTARVADSEQGEDLLSLLVQETTTGSVSVPGAVPPSPSPQGSGAGAALSSRLSTLGEGDDGRTGTQTSAVVQVADEDGAGGTSSALQLAAGTESRSATTENAPTARAAATRRRASAEEDGGSTPVVGLRSGAGNSSRRRPYATGIAASMAPLAMGRAMASAAAAGQGSAGSYEAGTTEESHPHVAVPSGTGGASYTSGRSKSRPLGGMSLTDGHFGEDGSQSSGASSRGSAAAARALNRLRRVLGDENQPLLRGLWWLRIVGLAVTVLAIVLAVVVTATANSNFESYLININSNGLGAQRMVQKANALLNIQDIMFAGRGWTNLSEPDIQLRRDWAIGNTSLFIDTHRAIFDSVQGDAEQAAQWSARYITVTNFDVPWNGLAGSTIILNLMEVGLRFATEVMSLAQAPFSEFQKMDRPDPVAPWSASISWLMYEGMRAGNTHETLANSMALGYKASLTTRDVVRTTQTVVLSIMLLVLAAIGAGVFLPILISIERQADKIMISFVTMPVGVRQALYSQSVQQLKTLRRNYGQDDDEVDEDSDGEEAIKAADEVAVNVGGANSQSRTATEHAPSGGSVLSQPVPPSLVSDDATWDAAMVQSPYGGKVSKPGRGGAAARAAPAAAGTPAAGAGRTPAAGAGGGILKAAPVETDAVTSALENAADRRVSRRRRRKEEAQIYRKSGRSFALLMFRFIGPLLTLAALFATIFGTFSATLDRSFTLSSIAAAANGRASCARQAMVDLRKLEFLTTNYEYIRNTYHFALDAVSCVREHNRLLSFGPSGVQGSRVRGRYYEYTPAVENGQQSVLSTELSQKVHDVMYADACPFLSRYAEIPGFNMTACRSFAGGTLKSGLASTTELWYRQAYKAGDRQLRGLFIEGFLFEGYGWLVPAETFDYSVMGCNATELKWPCQLYRDVTLPADGSPLAPTPLSDFSYIGDYKPADVPPNGSVPYRISHELTTPQMQFLIEADGLYLTPGLLAIASLYEEEASIEITTYLKFLSVFVPCYMSAFVLMVLFVFLPKIKSTNREVQEKRAMLLLLPVAVVARVRPIKELVDEILARDGDGFAAVGAHTVTSASVSARSTREGGMSSGASSASESGASSRSRGVDHSRSTRIHPSGNAGTTRRSM